MHKLRILSGLFVGLVLTLAPAYAGVVFEQLGSFAAGLGKPVRVTATSNGWAATYPRDGKVRIFDSAGSVIREINGLSSPLGIAFLAPDLLFIGEQDSGKVSVRRTTDGSLVRTFGTSVLTKPVDIALYSSSGVNVYVLDGATRYVRVYDDLGNPKPDIGDPSRLIKPIGVTVDSRNGALMVSEMISGVVHVFGLDGVWQRDIGGFGSGQGQFARTSGAGYSDLALGVIADPLLSRLQAIRPDGGFRAQSGVFGSGAGQMINPLDAAISPDQKVAVADDGNDRIDLLQIDFDAPYEASSQPDNVRVNLRGAIGDELIVTKGTQDLGSGVYVEHKKRTSGIRIDNAVGTINRGEVVVVSGALATIGGERSIVASSLTHSASLDLVAPVGVKRDGLGGTSPSAYAPSVAGGTGLYNIGMLTRVWGRLVSISGSEFYITDGSAEPFWIHAPGLTVPPSTSYILVTGICTTAYDTTAILRPCIVPRDQSDITSIPGVY